MDIIVSFDNISFESVLLTAKRYDVGCILCRLLRSQLEKCNRQKRRKGIGRK